MKKECLIVIFLAFFVAQFYSAWAQNPAEDSKLKKEFEILSPLDLDTVATNQLLIVAVLPKNYAENYKDFRIVLDDIVDLTELIKIKGNYLSVLYNEKLKPGMHIIRIYALKKGGREYHIVHDHAFRILAPLKENKWVKNRKLNQTGNKERAIKFNGNVSLLSNDVWLSGPGASLRQEPPFTREAALNFNLKINKIEIPFSGMLTTNARNDFQFRNFFRLGFKRGRFSLFSGDHFVSEDQLIFSGLRINGIYLTLPIDRQSTLTAVAGRNVDEQYLDNNYPLLPNQNYPLFEGGVSRYRRNFLFVKLTNSYSREINQFSISLLRVFDDLSQGLIQNLKPKENLVLGFENFYSYYRKKASLKVNLAISMLTNDRTIPAEEDTYKKIININSSTVPLNMNKLENLSLFLTYQAKVLKKHQLRLDAKKIGGAYYSLGNPYLMNNRIIASFSNRSALFKDKFFLSMAYDFMMDNISKVSMFSRENHSASAGILVNISRKIPSLNIGYRKFFSNTYSSAGQPNAKNTSDNLFGGIQYSFKLGSWNNSLSLNRNDMNFISELLNSNRQQVSTAYYSINYKSRTGIDLEASSIDQDLGGISLPQESISGRLWTKFNQPNLRLGFRYGISTVNRSGFGVERRETLMGTLDYYPIKNIIINLSGGRSPFSSYILENNYSEAFFQARVNVFF